MTPEQRIIDAIDHATSADERAVIDWIVRETAGDDRIVVLDDGQDSGVRVERHDDRHGPSWIDFEAGEIEISVEFDMPPTIINGPVTMCLHHTEIDGPWTLDDLRRLHRDLGRILADARLLGALDEAWSYYNQSQEQAA